MFDYSKSVAVFDLRHDYWHDDECDDDDTYQDDATHFLQSDKYVPSCSSDAPSSPRAALWWLSTRSPWQLAGSAQYCRSFSLAA